MTCHACQANVQSRRGGRVDKTDGRGGQKHGREGIPGKNSRQLLLGCGSANAHGLQIKSYWSGDEAVCSWHPGPSHAAGPPHLLNGGIIATIIDCHCVCTAIAAAYRQESRPVGTEPVIWYATASLQVSYLRPTPITGVVELRAQIRQLTDRKTTLTCSLTSAGIVCAQGEVVAVRVPSAWLS